MAGNINAAFQWAIDTCARPNVGYSKDYRNEQTVGGITYYDCSSFIWYALLAGGFDVKGAYQSVKGEPYTDNAITTHDECAWLLAMGFTEVSASGEWKPGDIGWKTGHTEMVYEGGIGCGRCMGAHYAGSLPLSKQVSIWDTFRSDFTRLFRWTSGNSYSLYVIAAIAGNWQQESNLNPGLWENLSAGTWTDLLKGYGLGQWTNTGGDTHGRLYQLHEWLVNNGYSADSGDGEALYMVQENIWYPVQEASAYADLSAFLTSGSTDLAALTHAFCIGWEGIHDASWDLRVTYANILMTYIRDHYADTSITAWVTGNRYLTQAEIKNNAVMLYRALNGFMPPVPPVPPGPVKKTKMPVWMMLRWT